MPRINPEATAARQALAKQSFEQMQPVNPDRLCSINFIAKALHLSRRKVCALMAQTQPAKLPGGSERYVWADVQRALCIGVSYQLETRRAQSAEISAWDAKQAKIEARDRKARRPSIDLGIA